MTRWITPQLIILERGTLEGPGLVDCTVQVCGPEEGLPYEGNSWCYSKMDPPPLCSKDCGLSTDE